MYTDSMKVTTDDIRRHYHLLGYRIGRQLGHDFYTTAFEAYWVDNRFDERPLVVKVIDFTSDQKSAFASEESEESEESEPNHLKTIAVKVATDRIITMRTRPNGQFVPDFHLFRQEIFKLNYLNHQNLVVIRNILMYERPTDRHLTHVLMFVEFNDSNLRHKLNQIHKKQLYVTGEQMQNWSAQLARGLAYLHYHGISHSNLKPSNISVFEDKRINGGLLLKLSDYGLAMLFPIDTKETDKRDESDLYRDPQIDLVFAKLKDSRSSETELTFDATRADIWSLAVIITELNLDFNILFAILVRVWTEKCPQLLGDVFLERVKRQSPDKQLIHLLNNMFSFEQKHRIDMITVCGHPWLKPTIDRHRRLSRVVWKNTNTNSSNENDEIKSAQEVNEEAETTGSDNYRLNDTQCEKFIADEDDFQLVV